jgi:hypothetical protein
VDWDDIERRFRERANSASSPSAFAAVVSEMLAPLADVHVWIVLPDETRVSPYHSAVTPNCDFDYVASQLRDVEKFAGLGFVGRTSDGIGYVAIVSLPPPDDAAYVRLKDALMKMFDAPGFIVDLRLNHGGGIASVVAKIVVG